MKKLLGTVFLAPPTIALIGFMWSFGTDITASMAKTDSNSEKIRVLDQRLYEIHWLMIQKNNIKVPPRKPEGVNYDRRNKQFRSRN